MADSYPSAVSRIPRLVPNFHRRHVSAPSKFEQIAKEFKRGLEEERLDKVVQIRQRHFRQQNAHVYKITPQSKQRQPFTKYSTLEEVVPRPPAGPKPHHGVYKRSAGRDKSNPLPPIHNARRSSTGSINPTGPSPVSDHHVNFSPQPLPFNKRPKLLQRAKYSSGQDNGYISDESNHRDMKENAWDSSRRKSDKRKEKWMEQANEKYPLKDAHRKESFHTQERDFKKKGKDNKLLQNRSNKPAEIDNSRYEDTDISSPRSAATISPETPVAKKPPLKTNSSASQSNGRAHKQLVLQRHNSTHHAFNDGDESDLTSSSSSGFSEIKRKEAELQAELEKKMADLKRINEERRREEELEKQAEERKRKKIAALRKQQERMREAELESLKDQDESWPAYGRRTSSTTVTPPMQQYTAGIYHEDRHPKIETPAETKEVYKKPPKAVNTKRNQVAHHAVSKTPELNDNTAFYLNVAGDPDAHDKNIQLIECDICGRKFASDRLDRHRIACKKSSKAKPRKVFDPVEMRIAGTEQAKYVDKTPQKPKRKKADWRAQHENFIAAIRYAKEVTKAEKEGGDALKKLKPPPVSENPDYVQCPHCSRRFNQNAAERHIPWCKEVKSRPPKFQVKRK